MYVRARCMLGLGVCSGYVYAWARCMLGLYMLGLGVCSG